MRQYIINTKILISGFCFLTLVLFGGCANEFKNERKDTFFDKWTTLAENSQGHSPAARVKKIDTVDITKKQDPSTPLVGPDSKKLPSSPIHLTMRQADLKAVLRAMAKSVNLNLLVKNELKGEISVDFKGVAWDEAFMGLLRTYGLSYVWEGDIVRVMMVEDIQQELTRKVQMRDIQWVEPLLEPVVINVDYADANKLAATLQDFLTKDKDGKARGSVKVDEHSNALIISAMRDDLKKIIPIIEKLDKPTHQILIKANIVETTKGLARDLGIMWGGYNRSTQGKEDLIVTGGGVSPAGAIGGTGTPPATIGIGSKFPG